MSGAANALKAVEMFTKNGRSKQVSLVRELAMGGTLGLAAGLVWQTWHWNEKRKTEEYYHQLAMRDAGGEGDD